MYNSFLRLAGFTILYSVCFVMFTGKGFESDRMLVYAIIGVFTALVTMIIGVVADSRIFVGEMGPILLVMLTGILALDPDAGLQSIFIGAIWYALFARMSTLSKEVPLSIAVAYSAPWGFGLGATALELTGSVVLFAAPIAADLAAKRYIAKRYQHAVA